MEITQTQNNAIKRVRAGRQLERYTSDEGND
jgi:hypothetical protein